MLTRSVIIEALLAVAFVCGVLAAARGDDPTAPTSAHRVIVDRIHDGDSVHGSIELGYGLTYTPKDGIRAYGYDCWELGRQREKVIGHISDAELDRGRAARDALIELLTTADLFAEDSGEIDPHGRGSSILWAKQGRHWIWLAGWMEARGHLRTPREKE